MRVLLAYNQHRGHGGGGDKFAMDTVTILRERGVEVEVFTKSSEALPKNAWGRLQAAGSILAAPASVREFTAALERFRPDVVHAFELFPLVSPYILPACTARGVPVVFTPVDYRLTCPVVSHLYNNAVCTQCCGGREYWAVLRNCRGNLAESVSVAAYNAITRKRGLFREHVAHYAVPSDFARHFLAEHLGIPKECMSTHSPHVELAREDQVLDPAAGRYVAFAGRFTVEKGVRVAVEAARLSGLPVRLARNVNARAEVAVPPELEVVTKDRDDLIAFYRLARFVIVPSIWFETFGIVGAEAMGFGLPLIASKLGAIGDLVEDGVQGLHFRPGDASHLAERMTALWNDPELCRRLGRAARAKAVAQWSRRSFGDRLLAIYPKAMGAGAK